MQQYSYQKGFIILSSVVVWTPVFMLIFMHLKKSRFIKLFIMLSTFCNNVILNLQYLILIISIISLDILTLISTPIIFIFNSKSGRHWLVWKTLFQGRVAHKVKGLQWNQKVAGLNHIACLTDCRDLFSLQASSWTSG